MGKKSQKKIIKTAAVVILVFVIVIIANFSADIFGLSGNEEIKIVVSNGETATQIIEKLKAEDIIKSEKIFLTVVKLSNYSNDFKAGAFLLNKGDSYFNICKKLSGTPLSLGSVWVTIPEGYELRQIADMLALEGLIDKEKFYDVVENADFEYEFLKDIPKRENRLEGYLFPDTYLFSPTDGEYAICNAMLKRFDDVLYTDEYKKRADELKMTMDEIVTLSSVIEREALGDSDRTLVSSVFHNRLKSSELPYLQSCATVQYIIKERKEVLSVSDTKINSPYNTYINKGLPVGPIASPGEEAFVAALYPEKSEYMFFVLDSSGKHRFAKTYEEHLKNEKR